MKWSLDLKLQAIGVQYRVSVDTHSSWFNIFSLLSQHGANDLFNSDQTRNSTFLSQQLVNIDIKYGNPKFGRHIVNAFLMWLNQCEINVEDI